MNFNAFANLAGGAAQGYNQYLKNSIAQQELQNLLQNSAVARDQLSFDTQQKKDALSGLAALLSSSAPAPQPGQPSVPMQAAQVPTIPAGQNAMPLPVAPLDGGAGMQVQALPPLQTPAQRAATASQAQTQTAPPLFQAPNPPVQQLPLTPAPPPAGAPEAASLGALSATGNSPQSYIMSLAAQAIKNGASPQQIAAALPSLINMDKSSQGWGVLGADYANLGLKGQQLAMDAALLDPKIQAMRAAALKDMAYANLFAGGAPGGGVGMPGAPGPQNAPGASGGMISPDQFTQLLVSPPKPGTSMMGAANYQRYMQQRDAVANYLQIPSSSLTSIGTSVQADKKALGQLQPAFRNFTARVTALANQSQVLIDAAKQANMNTPTYLNRLANMIKQGALPASDPRVQAYQALQAGATDISRELAIIAANGKFTVASYKNAGELVGSNLAPAALAARINMIENLAKISQQSNDALGEAMSFAPQANIYAYAKNKDRALQYLGAPAGLTSKQFDTMVSKAKAAYHLSSDKDAVAVTLSMLQSLNP